MKNAYYYEEVTRDGKQWWRMTPNGDWLEKRDTDNPVRTGDGTTMLATCEQKYDRAGIAARVMCGIISSGERGNVWEDAVYLTDQLIAELQRTEK